MSLADRRAGNRTHRSSGAAAGRGHGPGRLGRRTIQSGITALVARPCPSGWRSSVDFVLGERLPRLAAFGVVVGFIGVAILG